MTTQELFISKIASKALEANQLHNIKSSLTISQAIIESNWGKSSPGNMLFGMKWYPNCGYDYQLLNTKEFIGGVYITVKAKFKKYKSWDESLDDHTNLLLTPRYAKVLTAKNYMEATQFIKDCGYATSPTYPATLRNVIKQYELDQYDL